MRLSPCSTAAKADGSFLEDGMYFLGMDFGTGGAKTTLIDDNGAVAGHAFREYPILTEHAGWSAHDPVLYWRYACAMIQAILAESRVEPADIRGVAVSSAMPCLVMIDKNGEPVNNAYNLMDRRAVDQVERVREIFGDKCVFEVSKNRLDDHPTIVNLLWERDNRPDSFARVEKALTIDGYVTAKLTGKSVCHYSGAAFYGVAYDLLARSFNLDMLEQLGLSPDLFPELRRCDDVVGGVTRAAAEATGLAPGTPVAAGQVDCNAGWVGGGMINEGEIQMNLGTCGNFGVLHRDANFYESMIGFAYTTDSENTYITVPTTTTGGQTIRYLRDNYYLAEKAAEAAGGKDAYDVINREAECAPAGCDGLLALPFLMGERTPIWDVRARGVVFGLSLNHTRGHLARAMMEAVAFALYDSFRIIRSSGRRIEPPLVLNEGGAKSALWRRIITDVFDIPTVLVERRNGAPYGDAVLAGVATGAFPDYGVAKCWTRYVDEMLPDAGRHELYMEYFTLYKKLYEHIKVDFRELATLRDRFL
ncbi:MAG: carbohydrate kinase [Planctomycetota bacterium]|jgi:xylulokinase|nr:carbohydrate kinase [Planctomycetota bacterium]